MVTIQKDYKDVSFHYEIRRTNATIVCARILPFVKLLSLNYDVSAASVERLKCLNVTKTFLSVNFQGRKTTKLEKVTIKRKK